MADPATPSRITLSSFSPILAGTHGDGSTPRRAASPQSGRATPHRAFPRCLPSTPDIQRASSNSELLGSTRSKTPPSRASKLTRSSGAFHAQKAQRTSMPGNMHSLATTVSFADQASALLGPGTPHQASRSSSRSLSPPGVVVSPQRACNCVCVDEFKKMQEAIHRAQMEHTASIVDLKIQVEQRLTRLENTMTGKLELMDTVSSKMGDLASHVSVMSQSLDKAVEMLLAAKLQAQIDSSSLAGASTCENHEEISKSSRAPTCTSSPKPCSSASTPIDERMMELDDANNSPSDKADSDIQSAILEFQQAVEYMQTCTRVPSFSNLPGTVCGEHEQMKPGLKHDAAGQIFASSSWPSQLPSFLNCTSTRHLEGLPEVSSAKPYMQHAKERGPHLDPKNDLDQLRNGLKGHHKSASLSSLQRSQRPEECMTILEESINI